MNRSPYLGMTQHGKGRIVQPPTKKQLEAAVAKQKKAKKGDKPEEELEKLAALLSKVEEGKDATESANIPHTPAVQSGKHLISLGPNPAGDKEMIECVREELKKQGSQGVGQKRGRT